MIWRQVLRYVIWTFICFVVYALAAILTQLGEPATEAGERFQDWSGYAILIATPVIWIAGCVALYFRRAR